MSARPLLLLIIAALTVLDGCSCRKKTDEELLKAKIDATPVHLWLATKLALHPDGEDGDTREARKALLALIDAARKKDAGAVDIGPKEAASIAVSLWKLRGLGKEAFAKNDAAIPKPILRTIITPKGELDELLDARTEHAAFLIGLTVAKIHPKLAVPVPPELLLYEAWWTDPEKISFATFAPIARAFKAYVYGTSELCDLAAKEADAVPADGDVFTAEMIAHDLAIITGAKVTPEKSDTEHAGAFVSTFANGSTAICYLQRDEPEKANKPLRRTLDSMDRLGIEGHGVDFLRGYVECADGDPKLGEKKLREVIASKDASKREKDSAELLLARCGKKGALAKALDRATLASVVAVLALDQLERAGVVDALLATKLARTVVAVVTASGASIEKAKSAVPSYEDAKQGVKGWFGR